MALAIRKHRFPKYRWPIRDLNATDPKRNHRTIRQKRVFRILKPRPRTRQLQRHVGWSANLYMRQRQRPAHKPSARATAQIRSEERRVGKERRPQGRA